jgi:hypothetical protein
MNCQLDTENRHSKRTKLILLFVHLTTLVKVFFTRTHADHRNCLYYHRKKGRVPFMCANKDFSLSAGAIAFVKSLFLPPSLSSPHLKHVMAFVITSSSILSLFELLLLLLFAPSPAQTDRLHLSQAKWPNVRRQIVTGTIRQG